MLPSSKECGMRFTFRLTSLPSCVTCHNFIFHSLKVWCMKFTYRSSQFRLHVIAALVKSHASLFKRVQYEAYFHLTILLSYVTLYIFIFHSSKVWCMKFPFHISQFRLIDIIVFITSVFIRMYMDVYISGPSCSKLTTSLVNDSLKFTLSDTQICWNVFAENMWVAFAVQKLLTFFQQKISEYCVLNPLKQLTKWPLTSSLS